MFLVWISEQTVIISLYSINLSFLWPRQRVFTARYGLVPQIRHTILSLQG